MRLVFATQNRGKLREARAIFPPSCTLVPLEELPAVTMPEESAHTLEGNALIKARFIHDQFKLPCFADDSGLFITALNGDPGVRSARYAGDTATSEDNMLRVLREMRGKTDRSAYFKTVVALIFSGKEFLFEGVLNGQIGQQPQGSGGFGYDPIFIPEGFTITLAQMKAGEKNAISHRKKALEQVVRFLK